MSDMVTLTIDGKEVKAPQGSTVLEAAKLAGIKIPTLCYLKDLNEIGACRMCVVDVGARSLQASCVYPVAEGLKVVTNSPKVREARKVTLELLLLLICFLVAAVAHLNTYSMEFEIQNINKWPTAEIIIRYTNTLRAYLRRRDEYMFNVGVQGYM